MPPGRRPQSPPSGPRTQWEPSSLPPTEVVVGLVSKCRGLRGFHSKNSFFQGSGGWKSEIMVMAGLFPSEASLLGLQTTVVFSLCLHLVFPLCTPAPWSLSTRTPVGLG